MSVHPDVAGPHSPGLFSSQGRGVWPTLNQTEKMGAHSVRPEPAGSHPLNMWADFLLAVRRDTQLSLPLSVTDECVQIGLDKALQLHGGAHVSLHVL